MRSHYELFRVTVTNNGTVQWSPGGKYQSKCSIDVRLYPFDVEHCWLRFVTWQYSADQVSLNLTSPRRKMLRSCYSNGEWDIQEVSARSSFIPTEDIPFTLVEFGLQFRHKPLYHIINIMIPTLCLSLLVLLVLRLPVESGEKISMGVTLLLSFAVYMLLVSDSVPSTSDGVPVISISLYADMEATLVPL